MHVLDLFNDKDRDFLNGGSPVSEGGMPDLNLEYQDYLKLPPMAFQSRYKMSKEAWAEKYKNLLPKPAPVDPLAGVPDAPFESALNEVDPHNYTSDWDYYDALEKSGRPRHSHRSPDSDDTFDADVAYSKKVYQATKAAKEKAQHDANKGVAEGSQQVDSLVTDALKIMRGPTMDDAIAALKTVLGNREYNGRRGFYNFYIKQLIDMYGRQGVAEGSDNITAVFSGYGNYMKGRGANVFKHYSITVLDKQYNEDEDILEYTVSGSKEALDQARAYLERSDQFGGMIIKQGVAEEKVRLDPKCWTGKKIGNPKTKMKGGVRVNNCVPAESVAEDADRVCPQCGMKGCTCAPGKCNCTPRPGYPKTQTESQSQIKIDDYYRSADSLHDQLRQAIKMGDEDRIEKLKKERDQLDAQVKQRGMIPEGSGGKHRVGLTVTDPNHPMVSKRRETIQKTVHVPTARADGTAISNNDAVLLAVKHHKKKGYRVHGAEHLGIADQEVTEAGVGDVLAKLAGMFKRALAVAFGKKISASDPMAFQRMMSKIVAPVDSSRYQSLWQEYKNDKNYYVPTPHPIRDIVNKQAMYLWSNSLAQFVLDKYPDATQDVLTHIVEALAEIGAQEAIKRIRSGLGEAVKQRPRVRKYSKMRPDGSKAVRYEVLDYMGRRVSGQGPEGFDDPKLAKDFYYKNYDRLTALEENTDGNPTDTVKMDVPLLIRVMEFAREDAKTDMDLHAVAERLIELGKTGDTLTMQDYQDVVAAMATPEQPAAQEPVVQEAGKRYWCSTDKRWKDR